MRSFLAAACLLAAASTALVAQPGKDAAPTPRELALDNLLAERESNAAFDKAIADARKHGVPEQSILEARFLFHVDRREDAAIAALLPEFEKHAATFRIEDSAVFGFKEDWLAVIEYVKAIHSLQKGDRNAFKQHITEAFWLSPRQGAAFAPHIERLRLDEAMRSVKLDFNTAMTPLDGGEPVTPAALIKDRKALLIHFWSPWSRECEAAMQDFATTAKTLLAHDVAVLSLIPDDEAKLLEDARAMRRPLHDKPTGAWLIDSKDSPFGRELRVLDLPVMVLVSPDGKILFNGAPGDAELWNKLREVNADIARPEAADGDEE